MVHREGEVSELVDGLLVEVLGGLGFGVEVSFVVSLVDCGFELGVFGLGVVLGLADGDAD